MKSVYKKLGVLPVMLLLLVAFASFAHEIMPPSVTAVQSGRFTVHGPFTHRNLSVYLVEADDVIRDTKFVTLEQALKDRKVVIQETGNVQNLTISSKYKKEYVFIQSGDIIRGGKQDRTLSSDFIVPPGVKKMPLQSFCVERGRWQKRGGEDVSGFSYSSNQVASRKLRVANRYSKSQQQVWKNVDALQEKLATNNAGKSVQSKKSASSLELTLENEDVKKHSLGYVENLQGIVKGRKNIVGFIFAINGELNTAEVYGSQDLFVQLWPKLLKTAAVEAFSEFSKSKHYPIPSVVSVAEFLEYPQESKVKRSKINDLLTTITHESKGKVIFESLFTKEHCLIHISTVRLEESDHIKPHSRNYEQQLRNNIR